MTRGRIRSAIDTPVRTPIFNTRKVTLHIDYCFCGVYNVCMATLKNGYIYVWDKIRKRHNYQHRLIMEEFLGRQLTSTETIHHKNGNKSDNRIENLVLCQTMADHVKAEGQWGPIKQNTCNLCTNIHHAKGLCNRHYMQSLRKQ